MPSATMLDQATAMIEKAWSQPLDALEALAVRCPCEDPLLRSAMHTRTALTVTDRAVSIHQDRLHALTRPGYVPGFYEEGQITGAAVDLRIAQTESRAYLQAIKRVIKAREAATPADRAPAVRLAQAAVARSGHSPLALGQLPEQPAPSAAVGRPGAGRGPHR
ncbi:hypothetical protein ACWHA1_32430 [Streptomyces decoyicus]